jgi:hypothetical protein
MAKRISFFYRRTNLSGRVRVQLADRIHARCNPTEDVQDDLCIGVKLLPGSIRRDKLPTGAVLGDYYLDFIDHHTSLAWLARWPDIKVIVCSKSGQAWLNTHVRNPLTFIPQHHCNVARELRPDRPVKTVAYIGLMTGLPPWYDTVNDAVAKMGLTMRYFTDFQTREDVVNAYRQTDIQFQWVEGMPEKLAHTKNPMRVINGLSFGIPMVSNRLPAYIAECSGMHVSTETIPDAMTAIHDLATIPDLYGWYATHGPDFAEAYHLDTVAEMFRGLADG